MSEVGTSSLAGEVTEPPTVLIVDDDKDLADTYGLWLPDRYDVEIKYGGAQARKRLDDDLDLVLLDRRMPGIPGDELLEDILEHENDCPVAMLTAVEPDTDIIDLEFDEYLIKPITKAKLQETVDELLLRQGFEPDAQDYFAMESKAETLASRDPENLRDPEAAGEFKKAVERDAESDRVRELRSKLQRFRRITSLIREIEQELVDATEREEIEQMVCERLVEQDPYRLAWIGDYTASFQQTKPRYLAGIDDHEIDNQIVTDGGEGPITSAADTGAVQVVDDLRADSEPQLLEPLGLSTADQPVSASVIVPLSHQDTVYGVLTVYTDQADLFDEREIEVLSELGDSIADTIHSAEAKKLMLADTVVELEFDVLDTEDLFVSLSTETDARIKLKGFVPAADHELTCYLEVSGTTAQEFLDAAAKRPGVRIARAISDSADPGLCELRIADSSVVLSLIEAGANIESMRVDEGKGHLMATVAPDMDVRTVVEAMKNEFDDIELTAKRQSERDIQSVGDFRQSLENRLTDRQYSVLEAAYSAGYFDWPRESTAKELAESLDLAPPTLHEHLRGALKELNETFFSETGEFSEEERMRPRD